VTLNIAAERFADVADSVERTFRQVAADKGLEFPIVLDEHLPQVIQTDGKRLQQILANLLSNAFKFTAKGEVRLRVEQVSSGWSMGHPVLDRGGPVVAFSVSDTGIGIPPSKQRLIFEAFQQADGSTSREYGGTGLGLSISRELARLLGGEIRVASKPGVGSTFTLYLPAEHHISGKTPQTSEKKGAAMEERPAGASGEESAAIGPEAGQALAGRKALVVDDDIRNVFAMTSALEMHGMTVLHADSGREAVETLKREGNVDLVLMDVMMPGLDGLDTIRMVRTLEGYGGVPIIAVTAKAMQGDREKCLDAGANEYLAKPVNVDVLLATLAQAVQPASA
jgi:CheY-like chemotaxis protein/two-component sensor histidine kinase